MNKYIIVLLLFVSAVAWGAKTEFTNKADETKNAILQKISEMQDENAQMQDENAQSNISKKRSDRNFILIVVGLWGSTLGLWLTFFIFYLDRLGRRNMQ